MNAIVQPPPLPPRLPASRLPPARRWLGMPRWLWALIAACVLMFALLGALLAWVVGMGWELFTGQAQQALQAQPAVREHIGTIREMHVDLVATGVAPGAEEFVFRLDGERGDGRVSANFVSMGAEREIITYGVLTLADGRRFELQDQSAEQADACVDDDCADEPADDTSEDTAHTPLEDA